MNHYTAKCNQTPKKVKLTEDQIKVLSNLGTRGSWSDWTTSWVVRSKARTHEVCRQLLKKGLVHEHLFFELGTGGNGLRHRYTISGDGLRELNKES